MVDVGRDLCRGALFHVFLRLFDGSDMSFPLLLPEWETREEEDFVRRYVLASVYNVISVWGGRGLTVYTDMRDPVLSRLALSLPEEFGRDVPRARRTGYGRCLNVTERVLSALDLPGRFTFDAKDASAAPVVPKYPERNGRFRFSPDCVSGRTALGIDVGGTDIKLAAAVNGSLALLGEYDWNPAAITGAEEFLLHITGLVRLMRAGVSLIAAGKGDGVICSAFERGASPGDVTAAADEMERRADTLLNFDAIGVSFPDVVINDLIVGGETSKTAGIRAAAGDYEAEFAKITGLARTLERFTVPGGRVRCINDGSMAAFTAACESAAEGNDLSRGLIAHSLGTDLGSGWIREDGAVANIPLEIYNFIIDLGTGAGATFPAYDVRSTRNRTTGLAGSLQKYASQSGVFRWAAERLPAQAPEIWDEAVKKGFFRWEGNSLTVPTRPEDMRKGCLEFIMSRAGESEAAADIFRCLGGSLAAAWAETNLVLRTPCDDRTLFGRLVKDPVCFRLIREGAQTVLPGIRLIAADDELAVTPMMRQLRDSGRSVAQFAQAVGAVYYGCAR